MIQNNQELEATLARIRHFQKQVEKLREVETNPQNYRLSAGGFLAEIDRMNLEVREYLSVHPSELGETGSGCRNRHIKISSINPRHPCNPRKSAIQTKELKLLRNSDKHCVEISVSLHVIIIFKRRRNPNLVEEKSSCKS